jgi:ribosomal protein L37AE/L43A
LPKLETDVPAKVKPYTFHGLDLHAQDETQWIGECPFCGKQKFSVNVERGVYRCFVCQTGAAKGGGNAYTFMREIHRISKEQPQDYQQLAADRGLLYEETLEEWGVVKSFLTGEWLLPGYGLDGKLNNLYRYVSTPNGKRALLATPTMQHCLYGVHLLPKKYDRVCLNEGPWDAMALWEVMGGTKLVNGEHLSTSTRELSLLNDHAVVATPGCTVFHEHWMPVFAGKAVTVMFDNDLPGKNPKTGDPIPPAGYTGMKRIIGEMAKSSDAPREAMCLLWGAEGYDPELKHGYDVRDLLIAAGDKPAHRMRDLTRLFNRVQPVPADWVEGRADEAVKRGVLELELKPCESWKELRQAWMKSGLRWSEGLDRGLSVMLASILSTKAIGDQLWVKVISPPSSGKSVLCEALSTCRKYVVAKSTIRGFHSGFKTDRAGEEDHSLIALIRDRTLIIKDGDTLLQSPNVSQILSEARDIYDRVSRTHYRHGLQRDYEGINMTFILCGTDSLRVLDSSELGERFIDCVIIDKIDEEEEDLTAIRVAHRAAKEMTYVSNGAAESRDSPEMTLCKQLTGGYVRWLRENDNELLSAVTDSSESLEHCAALGKFIAFMRARPSLKQKEKAQREMSYRLVSQIVRLAKCLAVVLNRSSMDVEVMRRVTRCALDTSRGRTFELCKWLYRDNEEGHTAHSISILTGHEEVEEKVLLKFLRRIGAVEVFQVKSAGGHKLYNRWRLTARMRKLYRKVVEEQE